MPILALQLYFGPILAPVRIWEEAITIRIAIKQYPDSPAHVDDPMTTQHASQHPHRTVKGRQ
eukprot:795137-Prymnesium_polylepis.1